MSFWLFFTGQSVNQSVWHFIIQGCIFRLTCSHRDLTKDHVLTSAYVNFLRTVTRNVVNKSVWRKKDFSWLPLNKHAMNIWLSSLGIRAHLKLKNRKTSSCAPNSPPRAPIPDGRMAQFMQPCYHSDISSLGSPPFDDQNTWLNLSASECIPARLSAS